MISHFYKKPHCIMGKLFLLTSLTTFRQLFLLDQNQLLHVDVNYTHDFESRYWFVKKAHPTPIPITPGVSILDQVFEKDSYYKDRLVEKAHHQILEFNIDIGKYFPRVYRPIFQTNHDSFYSNPDKRINELEQQHYGIADFLPYSREQAIISITQLSLLIDHLKLITKTVHPAVENLCVYGSEIRNLLIVVCTEIEAQLRGIFLENFDNSNDRLTTNDYYRLCDPLRLKEYAVVFSLFPWLGFFAPFRDWDGNKPTKSLDWYDHYNITKHDREANFHKADINSVLQSIAALAIVLRAQYGEAPPNWYNLIGNFLTFVKEPHWQIEENYTPPLYIAENQHMNDLIEIEHIDEWVQLRLADKTQKIN